MMHINFYLFLIVSNLLLWIVHGYGQEFKFKILKKNIKYNQAILSNTFYNYEIAYKVKEDPGPNMKLYQITWKISLPEKPKWLSY